MLPRTETTARRIRLDGPKIYAAKIRALVPRRIGITANKKHRLDVWIRKVGGEYDLLEDSAVLGVQSDWEVQTLAQHARREAFFGEQRLQQLPFAI